MRHHFNDIRSRIAEPPQWWDEDGVPRYCEFGPREVSNIYAKACALVLIACQECRTEYRVAFAWAWNWTDRQGPPRTVEAVRQLHYGDPPNACENCASGATMNCDDVRVLEFWRQDKFEWVRIPEFEIPLADGGGHDDTDK